MAKKKPTSKKAKEEFKNKASKKVKKPSSKKPEPTKCGGPGLSWGIGRRRGGGCWGTGKGGMGW